MKRIIIYTLSLLLLLIVGFLVYFFSVAKLNPPEVKALDAANLQRSRIDNDFYKLGNSWIKKSNSGLWEMYVEAEDPYTRGCINGALSQDLVQLQEVYFVRQIKKLIPSETYLNYLKYAIAWFNRDLDKYVTDEYKAEIYGVSGALGDEYDFIGSKYQRILNYHAAHDIGHALQDKNMVVGCTSFSAWNQKSADSNLIVGRNFDFYVGDEFAQNKIVCFYNPVKGNKFVFITWGGFVGAVSGMNNQGLTVTINASKSDIPSGSATPISLVAREILQYASTIAEAQAIAEKRKTFVSESILVASVKDGKTAIIEKSPSKIGLYQSDTNYIICANNFQSEVYNNDPVNIDNKNSSSSMYRHQRMEELIANYKKIGPKEVAEILRNRDGLHNRNIGAGNEKAINQLIAHHSVIMQPAKGLIWISTQPYQLGTFECYDINKIFNSFVGLSKKIDISESDKQIAADVFLNNLAYQNFRHFKTIAHYVNDCIKSKQKLSEHMIKAFVRSNSEQYEVYALLGDYYFSKQDFTAACNNYQLALSKEIPLRKERIHLEENLEKCSAKQAN